MIDWLISVLQDYKQADQISQIGFLLGIGGLCAGAVAALRRWRRSGFERLENEIEELKRQLESAQDRAERIKAEKRSVEEELATVSARDPWSLLQRAGKERAEKNEEPALGLFRQAIENSAPTLTEAAVQLAYSHLACFGESEEVTHLATADRYARIAHLLTPDDKRAGAILPEIEAFRADLAARGRDFTAAGHHWDDADVFSRGADGLTGQALVQRLTDTVYSNIRSGRYHTALALARRSVALAERELPADDPLRLSAGHWLGTSLRFLGAYDDARQQLEAVLAKEERALGPEHPGTLATAHEIAVCLRDLGEPAAARERFEALLAKEERVLGPEHPSTLATRRQIGQSLDGLGAHAEAVDYLTDVGQKVAEVLGPDHPGTLRTAHALGLAMRGAGQMAEARATLSKVLAARERRLGPSHPETEETRAALAGCEQPMPIIT